MLYYRLGLATLCHLFVYWKLRLCWGRGLWNLIYAAVAALFSLIPFAGRTGGFEVPYVLSVTEHVLAGITCVAFLFVDVLRIVLVLADSWAKTRMEAFFTPCRNVLIASALTVCCFAYGFYEAWDVREVHVVISTPKLPRSVECLRIVQVTDIHLGGLYYAAHLAHVMEKVRAAEPDIFVITGDLVDGDMERRGRESALLAEHGAKYGAFAVPGNHEFHSGYDKALIFMERSGLIPLVERAVEVGGIVIVGLDEGGGEEMWPTGLEVAQDRFVLLLKHYPQPAKGGQNRFDLQLSGHTHGGQIWPLVYAMHRAYGVPQGLSRQNGGLVYVSNGTGFWGPPFRFLTPPEITIIDLIREI